LPSILAREIAMPVAMAEDGQPLVRGGIYVAPGGLHTRVEVGRLRVEMGPRENGHRPSVDVLFRSAAKSYGPRAIGIVLSGALDCGANGLLAIKEQGGVAIVQDPTTALNPQMPTSAIDATPPDYVVPPAQMGPLLAKLSKRPTPRPKKRLATA